MTSSISISDHTGPSEKDDDHLPSSSRQSHSTKVDSDGQSRDIALLEKQQSLAVEESEPPRYSIFTTWEKRMMALAAAATAFFSPLSAQIYLPALNVLSEDLHVSSSKINLTITTYMIFQGITPMFIGSLADSGGRRPAYVICFIIYIAANIGLALAPNYEAVLGLRCLQSAGSSSTVALCMAVVADIITSAERGQYVGFTVVPVVLAPALGPVIGGLLAQYLGWRAIFWFLAIFAGFTIILIGIFMPETCRHIVGDGSIMPPPMYRSLWQVVTSKRRNHLDAPKAENKFKFKPPNILESLMMLFEIETGLLLGTSSFIFAGFYAIASAMPGLFQDHYGYNDIQVGLMYLPLSVGSIVAALICGPAINWNYKRHCVRLGIPLDRSRQQDLTDFPIERVRLEVGLPLLVLAAVSLVAWGWAMQAHAHVAVLCVVSAFVGVGMIGFNNTSNTLLVDIHPGKAGTATASNNLTRCLVGAGASAAIVPMISAMGAGWAFTLIGGIYILCLGPLVHIMVSGMKWRAQQKAKEERKKEKKEALRQDQSAQAVQEPVNAKQ